MFWWNKLTIKNKLSLYHNKWFVFQNMNDTFMHCLKWKLTVICLVKQSISLHNIQYNHISEKYLYKVIFNIFTLLGPLRFHTEGIASSAVLSLRERRDRTVDDVIPSVQNLDGDCSSLEHKMIRLFREYIFMYIHICN